LIDTLLQSSRTALFTTSAPAALMAATLVAVELVITESWRREALERTIRRFRAGVQAVGLTLAESRTAIQLLPAGDNETVMQWSQALLERGLLVPGIRPPTVPAGSARLRISLTAAHTDSHVDQLIDALAIVCRKDDDDPR
jgi:8-amino-7-oxononanoate synthase